MENYFYYYGIIYLLHRLFIIGRGIYYRNKPDDLDDVDITNAQEMQDAIAKAVTPLESFIWFLNTVWLIVGLWSDEPLLFFSTLGISIIHLYYSSNKETKHKAFYFSHILKVIAVSAIMVIHFS